MFISRIIYHSKQCDIVKHSCLVSDSDWVSHTIQWKFFHPILSKIFIKNCNNPKSHTQETEISIYKKGMRVSYRFVPRTTALWFSNLRRFITEKKLHSHMPCQILCVLVEPQSCKGLFGSVILMYGGFIVI